MLPQTCGESVALAVFHHEIDRALAGGAQIVNCNCIRMSKTASSLPLALKTAQPFSIAAHFRRQDFDRDAIAEQNVTCTIDGTHSAFAQHAFDLILAIKHGPDQ